MFAIRIGGGHAYQMTWGRNICICASPKQQQNSAEGSSQDSYDHLEFRIDLF